MEPHDHGQERPQHQDAETQDGAPGERLGFRV